MKANRNGRRGIWFAAVAILAVLWATVDASATTGWVARYDGLASQSDAPGTIALDPSGNVIVAGHEGTGENWYETDGLTLKYDPQGNQLWAARYKGPIDGFDLFYSMAVDGEGNILVTGSVEVESLRADEDWITIKYDPNGKELWGVSHTGPVKGNDIAFAIAADAAGNAYVTGMTAQPGSDDITTIKYGPDGTLLWVSTFDGPVGGFDMAAALEVDDAGNVYVAGNSYGTGGTEDLVTLKYDSDGNELWAAYYDGPENDTESGAYLAVDPSGRVVVTTMSVENEDPLATAFVTLMYDPDGNRLWTARYAGPGLGGGWHSPSGIATDKKGNVFVTGESSGAGTDSDFATIKYDPDGNELWVARYDRAGDWDFASDLAVDAVGNPHVTGMSVGQYSQNDFTTIKYDQDGNRLWIAHYSGSTDGWEVARDITLGTDGTVYVTGEGPGDGTHGDIVTIQYPADGPPPAWGVPLIAEAQASTGGPGSEPHSAAASALLPLLAALAIPLIRRRCSARR